MGTSSLIGASSRARLDDDDDEAGEDDYGGAEQMHETIQAEADAEHDCWQAYIVIQTKARGYTASLLESYKSSVI